jgi:hypothetical protein
MLKHEAYCRADIEHIDYPHVGHRLMDDFPQIVRWRKEWDSDS